MENKKQRETSRKTWKHADQRAQWLTVSPELSDGSVEVVIGAAVPPSPWPRGKEGFYQFSYSRKNGTNVYGTRTCLRQFILTEMPPDHPTTNATTRQLRHFCH